MTDTLPIPETDPVVAMSEELRKAFHPDAVGKLPRITCSACSKAQGRVCSDHTKSQCNICGNYITNRHIHLDYVGHAEVTDRMLSVDPTWNWEPLQREVDPALLAVVAGCSPDTMADALATVLANSPPKLDRDDKGQAIGMWIKLTVGGVTRLGYGTVEPGKFEAEKQLIGDAIRNAAMRFGIALSLWSKGLLDSEAIMGDGPATEPTFPQWELLGYPSPESFDHQMTGMKTLLDKLPRGDARDPVRAWCMDHGYYRADPETGEVAVRPLPVKNADVASLREAIQKALDALPAPTTDDAPPTPPAAEQPVLVAESEAPVDGQLEADVIKLVANWDTPTVKAAWDTYAPEGTSKPTTVGATRQDVIRFIISQVQAGTVDLGTLF